MTGSTVSIRLRAYRGEQHDTTECFNGLRDEAADLIDSLIAERDRTRAEVASLKSELKEISIALNDPADNLIRTTAECVSELRKDAKRYLWLRDSAPEKWAPWADEREDTTPKEIDAAIDAALGEEKS